MPALTHQQHGQVQLTTTIQTILKTSVSELLQEHTSKLQ